MRLFGKNYIRTDNKKEIYFSITMLIICILLAVFMFTSIFWYEPHLMPSTVHFAGAFNWIIKHGYYPIVSVFSALFLLGIGVVGYFSNVYKANE